MKRRLAVILAISMIFTTVVPAQAAVNDVSGTFEAVSGESSESIENSGMVFAGEDTAGVVSEETADDIPEKAAEGMPEDTQGAISEVIADDVSEETAGEVPEESAGLQEESSGLSEESAAELASGSEALLGITDSSYGTITAGNQTYNIDSNTTAQSVLETLWKPKHFKDKVEVKLNYNWTTKWFLRLDGEWRAEKITIDLGGHTWTVTGSERLNAYGDLEIRNGSIRFLDTCSAPITVIGGTLTVNNVVFDHCKCGSHGIFEMQLHTETYGGSRRYAPTTEYFKGNVYMENCTFDHCTAGSYGSCIYTESVGDYVTFRNCEFIGCSTGNDGGVLYCEDTGSNQTLFENCAFVECISGGYGGVMHAKNVWGPIKFDNCIVYGCEAKRGGFLSFNLPYSQYIHYCTGNNNTVVYNCIASDYGGAVYAKGTGFEAKDFFFYQNSANYGGAIYAEGETMTFRHNDFYGNYATKTGGACYTDVAGTDFADNTFMSDGCGADNGKELKVCQKQSFGGTKNNTIWSDSTYSTLIDTKTSMPGVTVKPLGTRTLAGSGTQADPYRISSAEELYQLAINTDNGAALDPNAYYRLTTDIDSFYVSIGSSQVRSFAGHFDGGMHRVGLKLCGNVAGLFGNTYQADISNVITDGIVLGSYSAGGIVGDAVATAITNCTNYANVVNIGTSDTQSYAGGIAGTIAQNSLINHCKNKGYIFYTQQENRCGGICGAVGENAHIYNSLNYEKIDSFFLSHEEADRGKAAYAGGIAGENAGHIYNCANMGRVNVRYNGGGLCSINKGVIGNCYQAGEIPKSGFTLLYKPNDGVCGDNVSYRITDCYYYLVPGCADTEVVTVIRTNKFADQDIIKRLNNTHSLYNDYAVAEVWNLIDESDIIFGGKRTVTLHIGNGQGDERRQVSRASTLEQLLNDEVIKQKITQPSYRIIGWYTDRSLEEQYSWGETNPIIDDLELWPKWEEYRFEVDDVFYEITEPFANTVRVIERPDGGKYTGPLIVPDSVAYNAHNYKVTEFHVNCGKQHIDYVAFLCNDVPKLWEDSTTWLYDEPIYVHNDNYSKYKAAWLDVESTKCRPDQLIGFYYLVSDIHNDLHDVSWEPYPASASVVPPQPDQKAGYYLAGWREYDEEWSKELKSWYTGGPLLKDTYIRPVWLQQEVVENNVRYEICRNEYGQITARVLSPGDGKEYSGSVTIANVLFVDEYPIPVTAVASNAFANCPNLNTLTVEADVPPVVEGGSLGSLPGLKEIIVPSGAVASYKEAEGWKEYADKITGNGRVSIVATFDYNYEGASPSSVVRNVQWSHRLQEPAVPKRPGYTFTGWYEDKETTVRFNFSWGVFYHITLYAGWEKSGTYHVEDIDYLWSISKDRKGAECTAVIRCASDSEYPKGHSIRVRTKAEVEEITPATCTQGTKYGYSVTFEKTDNIDLQPEAQATSSTAADALGHVFKNHSKLYHKCMRDNCDITERHTDQDKDGSCDECGAFMYHEVILHYADLSTTSIAVADGWRVSIPQHDHPGRKSTWYRDASKINVFYENYTQIKNDIELWEGLTDIIYEIRWDAGEGTFADGSKVKLATASYDAAPELPENPSRESGYEFTGWSPKVEKVTRNITYYAEYVRTAPVTHTVVFDTNGGSLIAPQTVVDGSFVVRPKSPEKAGWTFTAWYKDEACTDVWLFAVDTVTEDMTLYAGWRHENLILTWDAGEGTFNNGEYSGKSIATTSAAYGSVPVPYGTPSKAGYRFVSWYPDIEAVTETTTYTAQYVENPAPKVYVVAFDTNGGKEIPPITATEGATISQPSPDPTKTGYDFVKWCRDEALTAEWNFATATVSEDMTLYADWNAKSYTITWDAGEGAIFSNSGLRKATTSGVYGQLPELPVIAGTPSKADYKFAAWAPDINPVKGNDTYTAVYVKETPVFITVVFDTNCEERISPQRVASGSYIVQPDIPQKEGYQFTGWYADADCTDAWDFNSDAAPGKAACTDGKITLYAGWKIRKVTLTWDINGSLYTQSLNYGTVPSEAQVEAAEASASNVVQDKEDTAFFRWSGEIGWVNPAEKPVTQDTVYQAIYEVYPEPVYWSIDDAGLLTIASDRVSAGTWSKQGCFDGEKDAANPRNPKEKTWEAAELKAAVKAVKVVGNVSVDHPEGWFDGCENLQTAELGGLDLRFADSLERMFGDCASLTDVNMSGCSFTGIRYFRQMFEDCTALKKVDFGTTADLMNAVDTWQMFAGCESLETLDISAITSNKLFHVSEMFAGCSKLKTIYVSKDKCPDYPSVSDGARMFDGCILLTGAKGTAYDFRNTGSAYAVIDQGAARRGYLTAKGTGPFTKFCYVYLDPCNGENVITQLIVSGNHVRKPADPVRSGYTFNGWYARGESAKYDFENRVVEQSPVFLSAVWTKNQNRNPSGGGGSSSGKKIPAGAVIGNWVYEPAGNTWTFSVGSYQYRDQWEWIYNPYAKAGQPQASWFHFDVNGKMQTGWQWIKDKDGITRCYYLYPFSDGTGMLGACQLGGVTPDGYTVDANGAWTVNGVVQTR